MRKKIVAGNWKMNKTVDEGLLLARGIKEYTDLHQSITPEIIICPPFTHLHQVTYLLKGSIIRTGAQNCSSEVSGAFTGEVSASMITSTGTEYVIIGHSERRSIFKESDKILNSKVKVAMQNGLKIIFCCGETLAQRESSDHFNIVKEQLLKGIFDLSEDEFRNIVIAYEPVWAIGTGLTATAEQAGEMHKYIRSLVANAYNSSTAENTSILYGGSCNPGNAQELFSTPDVDGGLIGGASLKIDDFCSIIESVPED